MGTQDQQPGSQSQDPGKSKAQSGARPDVQSQDSPPNPAKRSDNTIERRADDEGLGRESTRKQEGADDLHDEPRENSDERDPDRSGNPRDPRPGSSS